MISKRYSPGVSVTLPDEPRLERVRRARMLRRLGAAALALFVLAGATGLLGTRTAHASARGSDGWQLEVTYPGSSRPGHAVRFEVHVHHAGGLGGSVRVRMRSSYFNLFDENGFTPQAGRETSDDTYVYDEYAPPGGDDLVISSDTRIEPDRQKGAQGDVSVLDAAGRPLVTVRFHTRIWP